MGQHLKIMEMKSFPQIMTWVECFSHNDKDNQAQNLSYTFVQDGAGGWNQDGTALRKTILKEILENPAGAGLAVRRTGVLEQGQQWTSSPETPFSE